MSKKINFIHLMGHNLPEMGPLIASHLGLVIKEACLLKRIYPTKA